MTGHDYLYKIRNKICPTKKLILALLLLVLSFIIIIKARSNNKVPVPVFHSNQNLPLTVCLFLLIYFIDQDNYCTAEESDSLTEYISPKLHKSMVYDQLRDFI